MKKCQGGHLGAEGTKNTNIFNSVCSTYKLVFKGTEAEDFFTYRSAKKLLTGMQTALHTIYVASSHRVIGSQYAYGCKQVKTNGIYPYCFLDKDGPMEQLENPLKLLHRKLSAIGAVSE